MFILEHVSIKQTTGTDDFGSKASNFLARTVVPCTSETLKKMQIEYDNVKRAQQARLQSTVDFNALRNDFSSSCAYIAKHLKLSDQKSLPIFVPNHFDSVEVSWNDLILKEV